MPTNLPPDYFKIEEQYRSAKSSQEKAELLEEMLSVVPKHKGTDKLRADLRRKLSKLKATDKTRKRLGKRETAYSIDKEGAGTAVLVGPTNVGKSALVDALTNATPEVSASPFSTWTPTPGMMPVENVQIQLIDTPPLNREFVEPALMDLVRRSDMILAVVDLLTDPFEQLEETIEILQEQRVFPLHWKDRIQEERRQTFLPLIVLVNKNDDETTDEHYRIFRELLEEDCLTIPVSAKTGRNLDRMKQVLFDQLDIIRVFSKAPGKDPDLSAPFVLKKGSTIDDFAGQVHQDFVENLKAARVWGSSAFDGQMVGRDYPLRDGDVVELRV
jgi:small GTP-binding protein